MSERLQKIIANSGFTSRRHAEQLILAGRVKVNQVVVDQLGAKAQPTDLIQIDDQELTIKNDYLYYLLNKPKGFISSVSDPQKRATVVDLIKTDQRIYPVGRLDYDTTGVLLLTNDGDLTNQLTHPSKEIDKIYLATIDNRITKQQVKQIEEGVVFQGIQYSKAKVNKVEYDSNEKTSEIKITIHQGKNHEVKNIFKAIGLDLIELSRYSFAGLTAKGLKLGDYRQLTAVEVGKLKNDK